MWSSHSSANSFAALPLSAVCAVVEDQHGPEERGLRLAIACALPSDSQTLAVPVEVQVGAASASGATAIATAVAPVSNSGGMTLRILMTTLLLYWPPLMGLTPGWRVRQAMSSTLTPNSG